MKPSSPWPTWPSLCALPLALVLGACPAQTPMQDDPSAAERQRTPFQTPLVTRHFVSFPTVGGGSTLQIAGQLNLPTQPQGKMPAVLIAHGSGGVDTRGAFHAQALNEAGIATLEIDMWAARGLAGGSDGRPKAVSETLPDAYGALKFLSAHPSIDASRIGILGFSWGGVMAMLTATQRYAAMAEPGQRFVAHVPFYPVCWVYNRIPGYEFGSLTGAPVFIQAGGADDYDNPDSCQQLIDSLAPADHNLLTLTVYPGATHAFDRLEPAMQETDPYSHLGQGGVVDIAPSPQAAETARRAEVDFFRRAFGLTQ